MCSSEVFLALAEVAAVFLNAFTIEQTRVGITLAHTRSCVKENDHWYIAQDSTKIDTKGCRGLTNVIHAGDGNDRIRAALILA